MKNAIKTLGSQSRMLCAIALVAVIGFSMAACKDPNNVDGSVTVPDIWSNVTSLNQMNGTWKGYRIVSNRLIKDYIEEQGGTWDPSMQSLYGDMRVTGRVDMTTTINAGAKTQAWAMSGTTAFLGGKINILWPLLRDALIGGGSGFVFNDANHSFTVNTSSPAQLLTDAEITEMLNSGLQRNQNGTKIKMPGNSTWGHITNDNSTQMIFSKQ